MKFKMRRQVFTTISILLLAMTLVGCAQMFPKLDSAKAPGTISISEAERSLATRTDAAAVILYDKDGKIQIVTPSGTRVERCQLCSPELEAKFGKQCLKAGLPEYANDLAALSPKLCKGAGASQATLKEFSSISAIRHSGSECYTWYVCNAGDCQIFQYCW